MTKAKEIWSTLSKVDVSNKTEKKGNLTYLSWAWAWGVMMEHYPQATYKFKEPMVFNDGSMMVFVKVSIDEVSREMWLPVLNYKNQAIQNPSAMDINTARMRCLTKCLAMFGLGHYIYAGEDLPEAVKQENVNKKVMFANLKKAVELEDHWGVAEFYENVTTEQWQSVINNCKSEPEKAKLNSLKSKAMKIFFKARDEYQQHKQNDDELGMKQLREDLPEYFRNKLDEVA